MTSLPVLHLKATSTQNMVITDDLYETTATLYTFLRSTPSAAEREMAFQPFVEALQAAPSSGRSALMRKPNHRFVQLLETVALDDVFRRTPQTIPAMARHADRWIRRLGYGNGVVRHSTPSKGPQSSYGGSTSASGLGQSSSPSPPPSPSMQQVVRAVDMHQFDDPYAAYEAQYRQRTARTTREEGEGQCDVQRLAHAREGEVEEYSRHSDSTQVPDDLPGEDAAQPSRSYLSAEVSALTATEGDTHAHDGSRNSDHRAEACDGPICHSLPPTHGVHPVLELIARQVEQAVTHSPRDKPSSFSSSSSSSLDERIKNKFSRLTSRLDEAAEGVSAAMHEKAVAEQVWSPYYSRLKASMSFVEELQQRLGSAISLYQLQRYERETLQQARVAVQMEALSLKLVLRDVCSRLVVAEEQASDPAARRSIEEEQLMSRLREVLRSPEHAAA